MVLGLSANNTGLEVAAGPERKMNGGVGLEERIYRPE